MPRIRYLRLGQMESVGASGNTTANIRLPIGLTYLGLIFIMASTTTSGPVNWSGTDIVRTLFNGKIGTQTTMDRVAMVQDARQLGAERNVMSVGGETLYFRNSITWPAQSVADDNAVQTPAEKAAFFLNFGQESAAPPLTRRFLSLNTSGPSFKTFDVQIQLGAYTTPQITVIAVVNDDASENQSTEVVSMIRETQWAFSGGGEKVVTDLPPYTYRQIVFDDLEAAVEGFSITLDSLELANTIDVGVSGNRPLVASVCNTIFGIQGTQTRNQVTGIHSGPQSWIVDPAGNVDNVAVVTNQSNVQLRFNIANAKTITGVMEILGNPLTT